jgi:hypothetical protein
MLRRKSPYLKVLLRHFFFKYPIINKLITTEKVYLPGIRYTRSIHEYLRKENGTLVFADCRQKVNIFHSRYSLETMYAKNKYQRNLTMLMDELKKYPTDSELHLYLADTYRLGGEWLKANFHLKLAIQSANFRTRDLQRLVYILKIITDSELSQNSSILEEIEEYLRKYPDNPELMASKGLVLWQFMVSQL